MSYFRKHNRRRFVFSPVTFGLTLVVLLLVLLRLFFPGTLIILAAPVWQAGTVLDGALGGIFSGFSNARAAASDRDALARENTALMQQNAVLTARAEDLQNLLGTRTSPEQGVLASVLVRPPVAPYDTLVIDAGAAAGVRANSLVLADGGVPVGTIARVASNSARVLLFSAPGRETAAWAGAGRTPLTLIGMGAGASTATLPREAAVAVGDTVYVPGAGVLPVGTIVKIESDPSSPKEKVFIRPVTNIFSVTWVQVMPESLTP